MEGFAARIDFDPALPITARVAQIGELIQANQVVIVTGETGSGKTTQLPKICLQLGRQAIAHTQPRRIAARSVATRICAELGVELGDLVGYQVRFTRQASQRTRIKLMTDGLLLAEINHDRQLRRYDTIIIDEAHERSLNIDFLLGYLKQLPPKRPDLKVIITSATIDTQRFSEHFDAPVIEVSGRGYPVEVRYQPVDVDGSDAAPLDQAAAIAKTVGQLIAEGPGDILVFLSGEREIKDAAEALGDANYPNLEVLSLYARLPVAEQSRVFAPHTHRRVVLATNVAETSLTVPGIVYVIDPGTARISRYSARTKVQRLPIEPISQASANQRAGRCGRVAPGVCVRLYSKEDFESRPAFTEPEILRTNLASVILQMAQAKLGDIGKFPFVDPPDPAQVRDGIRLLDELGALAGPNRDRPRLTDVGRKLANLPIDPRLGRMLVEADRRHCLREVLVIVAALAIQDVRERPDGQREQADALHARFGRDDLGAGLQPDHPPARPNPDGPARHTAHTSKTLRAQMSAGQYGQDKPDPGGDVIALLRLWRYLEQQRLELSANQFRRMCRDEFLNYLRVREWQDLHAQLRDVCKDLGMHRNAAKAEPEAILTAVLSGLLSHVGLQLVDPVKKQAGKAGGRPRRGPREFLGARQAKFAINPGSLLARHPPELVMAVELVETSRLWARIVAGVDAQWIEQVGAHLLKRTYSQPHWSSDSGCVVAYEKVSLYGVPVIADRLVNYARIDAAEARRIFIQAGLVEGGWRPRPGLVDHDFLAHNEAIRAQAAELSDRVRRQGLVVDDRDVAAFYAARLPESVVSGDTFDAWWCDVDDHSTLNLKLADLVGADGLNTGEQFPGRWPVPGGELAVSYTFDPGSARDGVTVHVALSRLSGLRPQPFSWQVPGLRAELATELIRALPKSVRTSLVPAPDKAREALAWLQSNGADRQAEFSSELGRALAALTGVVVRADQWAPDKVPAHLQIGFEVLSPDDGTHFGKDLSALQAELSGKVAATLTKAARRDAKAEKSWVFGSLHSSVQVKGGAGTATGYPALQDTGAAVRLVMADTPAKQQRIQRGGVRRLLVLVNPDPTRWVVAHLSNVEKLALPNGPYPDVPALLADARLKACEQAAGMDLASVRDQTCFEQLALKVRKQQADQMRSVVSLAAQVHSLAAQVRAALAGAPSEAADDVTTGLDNLVFDGYLSFIRDPWLAQLPRYLKAMLARLNAARLDPARDARLAEPIYDLQAEFDDAVATLAPGRLSDGLDDVWFGLEELRVQTFAQSLGTSITVSGKRIRKQLAAALAG